MNFAWTTIACLVAGAVAPSFAADVPKPGLRAGAAAVDVSPTRFPVLINGGFLLARAEQTRDPLHSRALVLDDGTTRLAIVVVDSCMMPRELLDRAKAEASQRTGIPVNRMLISATHTHTAPAAMGALGCPVDDAYAEFLPGRIAESIARANANLAPAQVGWGAIDDDRHTHCRRWIRRPDKLVVDPFGQPTGRANMHPGHLNPDAIAPSGPVDPQLSVMAVRTPDGRPVALLANYSMHYFGAAPASADYYGRFASNLEASLTKPGSPPFVAIMSQGTSGDQQWMDYGAAQTKTDLDSYAKDLARSALRVYEGIHFRDDLNLAFAETTLSLRRRTPDDKRLAWARPIVAAMGDRPPKTIPEVYAKEALYLDAEPVRELKLQALRIGDLGITAIPDEVYALTGLKIKTRSPLASTFTIELANGSEGYIPPPEQHALGGYTTWPARTAGLEVQAEPRIVETVLKLLETVAGRSRRVDTTTPNALGTIASDARPWAYFPLNEMDGTTAKDATGQGRDGRLEPGYAWFLEGVPGGGSDHKGRSRAVHMAGGRLTLPSPPATGPAVTVSAWLWNGLPVDARTVTGTVLDLDGSTSLVLGGTSGAAGRLAVQKKGETGRVAEGSRSLVLKSWHHVAVVCEGPRTAVYLDGDLEFTVGLSGRPFNGSVSLGGSAPTEDRFEGKIDEVAVFDRALSVGEIKRLAAAKAP